MRFISSTLDTSQFEMSPLNACAPMNMPFISITLDTSHFEMSPLNNSVPVNMLLMSPTLATSHFEISPSKSVIANVRLMSVILDTYHSPIGPSTPTERSHLLDSSRHESMAFLSSDFDSKADGGIVVVVTVVTVVHFFCDIDPGEPSKMRFFSASE